MSQITQQNMNISNSYLKQKEKNSVPQFKSAQQSQIYIPNYYLVNTEKTQSLKNRIKSNPALALPYDMFIKPFVEHPFAIFPTWLGLGLVLDEYSRACGGEYEKSLVKKAANLGDKIENSKLIQSKPVQTFLKIFKLGEKAGSKVVQNSAILRAMRDTPSMPEWSSAKTQMYNQKQEVVQEFLHITDALKLSSQEAPALKDIGLADFEKKLLKKVFNVQKISQIPEQQAVVQVLLNRLGKTPEQIAEIQKLGPKSIFVAKQEILKEMGLDAEKLNLIREDSVGKYIDTVKNATQKVRGRVKMGAGHYSFLGPLTKPFERTIGCDEVFNKLHSLSKEGTKTATGRFFSKAMQMFHRGITFNSGKLGALVFISPIFIEIANNVKKADEDQKVGTLFGGFIESTSWVLTFPLALQLMHKLGGAQYAGMGKDKVALYRKKLQDFNKRVESEIVVNGTRIANPNAFKTKAEYDIARKNLEKELKILQKVKGQNIFTKGIRNLARFLTLDLEIIKNYNGGSFIENLINKSGYYCRNTVGIPLRFVVWGLISMGVLGTAITKASQSIFGKSYDAIKQEENEDNIEKEKEFLQEDLNKRIFETAALKQKALLPKNVKTDQINNISLRGKDLNALESGYKKVESNKNIDSYTYIPSSENIIPHDNKNLDKTDSYTYIPSQECNIKSDNEKSLRKYIPSQAGANISKSFDNSGLQSALDRAQRAEKKALKILAGNFEE